MLFEPSLFILSNKQTSTARIAWKNPSLFSFSLPLSPCQFWIISYKHQQKGGKEGPSPPPPPLYHRVSTRICIRLQTSISSFFGLSNQHFFMSRLKKKLFKRNHLRYSYTVRRCNILKTRSKVLHKLMQRLCSKNGLNIVQRRN